MKEYVVGFAFRFSEVSNDHDVLLLIKEHPEWQKGRLNGVGGKVEIGKENEIQAMSREFYEEVGVDVPQNYWVHFCTAYGCRAAWKLTCFWTNYWKCSMAKKMEDEEPVWVKVNRIYRLNTINNLRWLIPMAMAKSPVIAAVTETHR